MKKKPLSFYRQKALCPCFAHDFTTTQTARVSVTNRNTVSRCSYLIRVAIYHQQAVKLVGKLLGHRDLATTQIYAKITADYLGQIADKLDAELATA